MIPDENLYKAGEYTIVGTGLVSLMFFAIRKMIRTISADSLTSTQENMQKNTLTSLHDEITRLESLIIGMQVEITSLRKRQDRLKNKLIEAQIALVSVEMSLVPCGCENVERIRTTLMEVRRVLLVDEQEDDEDGH